ncbi:MAG: helix-turn-helix transcriptional regulator [Butyrivibrio sp.]|nr:helix-turn-helix transcriptional regulator [Butyrivibrio sp.]
MALPLPQGKQFTIVYRMLSGDFEMTSMEVAQDHYSLGLIIHGDRKVITPTKSFMLHKGYINGMPPFAYHRTVPGSADYYENYLIKFSPDYVKELTDTLGLQFLDNLYSQFPKKFSPEDEAELFGLARTLLDSYNLSNEVTTPEEAGTAELKNKYLLYALLLLINDKGESASEKTVIHNKALSKPIMEAVYYIEKNYKKPLGIEEVAAISGYSVSYFSKIFKSQLGKAFSEYLCLTRLKHVQNLLLSTDMSAMDISLECGFPYPGNMTASFKKEFGMTPLKFRKNNKGV